MLPLGNEMETEVLSGKMKRLRTSLLIRSRYEKPFAVSLRTIKRASLHRDGALEDVCRNQIVNDADHDPCCAYEVCCGIERCKDARSDQNTYDWAD